MATYTSKAPGDFNADGQTTWNEAGHPDGADDTVTISHAITASAGIVCGAITVTGTGSLDTGTIAATITSITNAAGTGTLTIGTGGVTIGNNVLLWDAGNCVINGNIAGLSSANPSLRLGAVTGTTTTIAAGVSIQAASNNSGRWHLRGAVTIGAGASIGGTNAPQYLYLNSVTQLVVNGTIGAGIVVLKGLSGLLYGGVSLLKWCDITGQIYSIGPGSRVRFSDCSIDANNVSNTLVSEVNKAVVFERCYIFNAELGLYVLNCDVELIDVVFGYNRAGTADANLTDINAGFNATYQGGTVRGRNVLTSATTPLSWDATDVAGRVTIDNYGHVSAGGTGSIPANAAGVALDDTAIGRIERSTAAKKTGDFGAKLTPRAQLVANWPLELSLYLPISSGDDISVSVYGLRSKMTDDCAEIEIDPEGAWYTPVVGTATMTNEDQFYEFTATRTGAGGTSATGMVRIVLRVKEYEAANYFYWADFTATVGGVDYTVDFAEWSQGVPVASRVVAGSGGGGPLVGASALISG